MTRGRQVTVIGSGIVGVCCARFLQRSGFGVTLVDRDEPGAGASFGNLGMLCSIEHALPLPSLDVLLSAPRMLADPNSPLAIRWRYLPRLAPWLLRFAGNAPAATRMRNARALATLLADGLGAYARLTGASPAARYLRRLGLLSVYGSERRFAAGAAERERLRSLGARMEELDPSELRQLEPALHPRYRRAVYFPDCGHCLDPLRLTRAIAQEVRDAGGAFRRAEVRGFDVGSEGVRALYTSADPIRVESVVVAAGAWSGALAGALGSRVPLDTERGYHSVLHGVDGGIRRSISDGETALGLTQMIDGLRIGGTVELAGLDAAPNYERARIFYRHGRRMLPDLPPDGEVEVSRWMGFRPSLPDHLPVLGASPRHRNVWFAFGHQHLGLSLGARSGEIVAALVAGADPGVDLQPFRINRFWPWTH